VTEPRETATGRARTSPGGEDAPGQEEIERLARTYYDNEGEFHGQYVIADIVAVRLQKLGPRALQAHVRYRFRCVRSSCCCGDSGFDQRVFRLERRSDGWTATGMGGHMSASF
jgi:hypothetical protein